MNPRTIEEARAFVMKVESMFTPWNVEALVNGFTEDCVVRFGELPEMQGRAELEKFFRARSARQKGYRLKKELHAFVGDTLANTWTGEWEDAQTGNRVGKVDQPVKHSIRPIPRLRRARPCRESAFRARLQSSSSSSRANP
jgi:nuclear transport factor 2 (NTF2) superfamily protein